MLETAAFHKKEAAGTLSPDHHRSNEPDAQDRDTYNVPGRSHLLRQVLRFGLAGGLNTLVDVLILNGLLWLFPTTSTLILLAYNSLAFSLGAVNSFLLNKYWTFGQKQRTTRGELARFTLITLCSIGWSSAILWLASTLLHPFLVNTTVWANASKVVAIAGTALISYLGMRLWVFVSKRPKKQALYPAHVPAYSNAGDEHQASVPGERRDITGEREQRLANEDSEKTISGHSLSLVLPAYNEDAVIGATLGHVLNVPATTIWKSAFITCRAGEGAQQEPTCASLRAPFVSFSSLPASGGARRERMHSKYSSPSIIHFRKDCSETRFMDPL